MVPSPTGITPDPINLSLFREKIKTAWAVSPFCHQACIPYLWWQGKASALMSGTFYKQSELVNWSEQMHAQDLPWLLQGKGNNGITWFGAEPFCDELVHITCTTGLYASLQGQGGTMVLYNSMVCPSIQVQCCWMGCSVAPAKKRNCRNAINIITIISVCYCHMISMHLHPFQSLQYL